MTQAELTVTFRGTTYADVVAQAEAFVQLNANGTTTTATKPAKKTTATKKAAPPVVEDADEELLDTDADTETEDTTDELSFDSTDDDETETEEAPAKPAKKTPKITDKDVNSACMAHAKKHGRPETMKILTKKFKVKSILELKADQYADVLKALKV